VGAQKRQRDATIKELHGAAVKLVLYNKIRPGGRKGLQNARG